MKWSLQPLCYYHPRIKWLQLVKDGRRTRFDDSAAENSHWVRSRQQKTRLQWRSCVCTCKAVKVSIVLTRWHVTLREMTAVKWIRIPETHLVTQCLVEQQQTYSIRRHTHTYPHAHTQTHTKQHTRVSNNYKEENGVRASADELPCSLSIKLPLLCLSFILFFKSFFFRFK